jgi:hypothetical protein
MTDFTTTMQFINDNILEAITVPDIKDIQRDFHLVKAALKGEGEDVMQKLAADPLNPEIVPLLKAQTRASELLKQHGGNVLDASWAHTMQTAEQIKVHLDIEIRDLNKRLAMREREEMFRETHRGPGPYADAGEPLKMRLH